MKTQHITLTLAAMLCLALLSGCQTAPDPIRTTLDLQTTEQGLPAFNYASEKDVIYSRTSGNETVEFKALASAAAYAQAEREQVQAEASRAQAEALSAAVRALGAQAAGVLGSPQPQPAQP